MATYKEQFDSAMECETVEQATAWLEKEIARYKTEFGKDRKEATRVILANLGYIAGYYDHKTAEKVHRLFGANHPIFGHPDYHKNLSAEDCVRIGQAQARRPTGGKRD